MIRKADAVWIGTGRTGYADLSTDSGVLNRTLTRFEPASEAKRAPTLKSSSLLLMPAA